MPETPTRRSEGATERTRGGRRRDPASPPAAGGGAAGALALVRLARPQQWVKGGFVVLGPLYAAADGRAVPWAAVAGAVLAFSFASSACYVANDIRDREEDRAHPRKRLRPVASGQVATHVAWAWSAALVLLASVSLLVTRVGGGGASGGAGLGGAVALYVAVTMGYSAGLKRVAIVDVMCLALGFVLRVLGGCAAGGVAPSTWLLNCTFFVAMFLALGKRLGERRTVADDPSSVRSVQSFYTDDLLRMAVVVTGVAVLVSYAAYVQARDGRYGAAFNLLWLTMIPATYGLLRCIVLLERGDYDDPTELATRDRPFQLAAVLFAGLTLGLVLAFHPGAGGG